MWEELGSPFWALREKLHEKIWVRLREVVEEHSLDIGLGEVVFFPEFFNDARMVCFTVNADSYWAPHAIVMSIKSRLRKVLLKEFESLNRIPTLFNNRYLIIATPELTTKPIFKRKRLLKLFSDREKYLTDKDREQLELEMTA